jgi:4-diphosphocytidyl-2-C-methyl-D-erythritol kinase
MLGLCTLWGVHVRMRELSEIARRIGQDIPACLESMPARFVGIGDVVIPAPVLPQSWLVLANPGHPLATPRVFGEFRSRTLPFSDPAPIIDEANTIEALAQALSERRNDLETVARSLVPAIGDVMDALADCENCLLARMSGSGPTCFGLFPSASHARTAARRLARAHKQWWVSAATWYAGRPVQSDCRGSSFPIRAQPKE